ncbi:MAG: 2'-5' RNA ligase family protein [Acidimicrobiales bacterium]
MTAARFAEGLRPAAGPSVTSPQSALLVPVPEAEALVGSWRAAHDPTARAGVPAHITLVVPWIPPEQIKQEHFEELEALLAHQRPFDYSLEAVRWFGKRVLWLAPSPAAPFKWLTSLLADHFETPPWQGEFPEVVPHLTVGLAGDAGESSLAAAAEDLASKLPLACRAHQVDVMCGDGADWTVVYQVRLRG